LYRAYAYFHNQGLSDIKIVEAINELVFIPTKDDTNILYQNNEITSGIRNEEIAKTCI
jgi:cytidylate kinase